MDYNSTRNSGLSKPFDEIIIDGLSSDGGLYMPKKWPEININDILTWADGKNDVIDISERCNLSFDETCEILKICKNKKLIK